MNILIIGATGLFGSRLCELLAHEGNTIFAMTRDPKVARELTSFDITGVIGDLDDPESLRAPMQVADSVFLASPIHANLGEREANAIRMAEECGVEHIVKVYGSVRHDGDELDDQHQIAIKALHESDLYWTLVSPQSVMETALLPQADSIRHLGQMFGSAGDGKVGFVSADDCALAASIILNSDPELMDGRNIAITGPEALTHAEVADRISAEIGRDIHYTDLTEGEFRKLLVDFGLPADDLEMQVLCHFRSMREGGADLVTNTFEWLTGRPAMTVSEWIRGHRRAFMSEEPSLELARIGQN
jgi:uncharacterized protein YbjT (DUF2867 family)